MKTWQKIRKNQSLWRKYFIREKVIQAIREFFIEQKFHEVETPLLVPSVIPESYLNVFATNLFDRHGNKQRMFLTTSPEASIKKLLVAGIGNCFEITKSFRNAETGSKLHNSEFTILEWYRINANYEDLMKECERLIKYIYVKVKSQKSKVKSVGEKSKVNHYKITYQDQEIDLSYPWGRITVAEALEKYSRISFDKIITKAAIIAVARAKGYSVNDNNSWEEIFNQIFLNEIEPHLGTHGKPTIIYDYPKPLAALAKIKASDPRFVERFELYIGGLELADCYTELNDYKEQKNRFLSELQTIKLHKKIVVKPDLDFLEAIKQGLPTCSGVALGVDRLVMLFTDSVSIDEVLLFPAKDLLGV